MSDTMVQSIEKALGREPPVSQNEKEKREHLESVAEGYRQKLENKKSAEAAGEDQISGEPSSSYGQALVDDLKLDLGVGGAPIVPAITVGLAVLLVIVSFVTFRLARRNRMMRESGYFNNQAISNMAQKQETVLWVRKQSPNKKEYQKFVGDVRRLVEDYNKSGEGKIDLSEAWRKQ